MKILFLGIDALDSEHLERFAEHLPTLTRLRAEAASRPLRSTFPPDSDTAWATISTGMNPAQHGIVRFVDPLEKSYQILNVGSRNDILRGKTFWELLGKAGKKAIAVFPHLCYPVWDTPGLMIARGSSEAGVQATEPAVLAGYPEPRVLLGVRGFPERSVTAMQAYASRLRELAQADAEFALKLMREREWDLFFVYWSTLDAVGHFFWSYFDKTDPGFVEGHSLQEVILETYKQYDQLVAQFLAEVDDDVTVIVMSDHGHAGRPLKLMSVNEVLRQGGFLKAHDLKRSPHVGAFEQAKRLAVYTVSRFGLAKLAGKVMRRFPGAMKSFTRPASIDWGKTTAYATDMSGIKSYTYGGIMINRDALDGRDYEAVRSEIIDLLKRFCVLPDGTSLIDFIARREEVYVGPYITNYPDIVLEFKYGYGVGWAVNGPLITQAAAHNLVPGSHRGSTGIFMMRTTREVSESVVDLHDITPTILDLMGVAASTAYDGSSILAPVEREELGVVQDAALMTASAA